MEAYQRVRSLRNFAVTAVVFAQSCGLLTGEPSPTSTEKAIGTSPAQSTNTETVEHRGPGLEVANSGTPIRYRVSFEQRSNHYLSVEARIPTDGRSQIDVVLPVWTPGSYSVRDYAGQLEGLRALVLPEAKTLNPPQVLTVSKLRKNRWRVLTEGAETVTLRYKLYAAKASVRTNWVGDERAVLVGAATFLTRADALGRAHEVLLQMPHNWKQSVTGLPSHADGAAHHYTAANYDVLVDSPLVLGNAKLSQFEINGVPHRLANVGGGSAWNDATSVRAAEVIARQAVKFWGTTPYKDYTFLNLIGEGRGGLEHLNSTLMMTSRWSLGQRDGLIGWMGLVSHEFFHTWNVKRLRPVTLGPFDYDREIYTRSLWVAEGLTSYYDDLLLVRAGLITRKEYLKLLSKTLRRVQTTVGRRVQSLEMASFDAWIKYYRSDENSGNSQISYYSKGSLVGWILDAQIRENTATKHSLDTVMTRAYQQYSGKTGYTPQQFEGLASEVAGRDLSEFFNGAIRGTQELNYEGALQLYGLRLGKEPAADSGAETLGADKKPNADAGVEVKPSEPAKDPEPGYLGLRTVQKGGQLLVNKVQRGTPAWKVGFQPDDELLAVDGYRLKGALADRLKHYAPEREIKVLVSRRGELQTLSVTLGAKPDAEQWTLSVVDKPTAAQSAALDAWLGTAELVSLLGE